MLLRELYSMLTAGCRDHLTQRVLAVVHQAATGLMSYPAGCQRIDITRVNLIEIARKQMDPVRIDAAQV